MDDEQIRRIVREVLASREARRAAPPPSDAGCLRMTMVPLTPPGSPCVIEPAVGCNQCGYCVSLGH